jgi:Ca2+-binding EF-hand superfamily protein
MEKFFYRFVLMLFTVCITQTVSPAVPNPAHKARVADRPLSDKQHFDGEDHEEHNMEFDHDAFLGKEDAKKFDEMTPVESQQQLGLLFVKIDKNGDLQVTKEELREWMMYVQTRSLKEETKKQWEEVNPHGNEFLTWEEYEKEVIAEEYGDDDAESLARDHKRWEAADTNHDSLLSLDEFHNFLHPEAVEHMKDLLIQETMDDVDANGDGKISLTEYMSDAAGDADVEEGEQESWAKEEEEEFRLELDKNKDGILDHDEIVEWLVPDDFNHIVEETDHLFEEGDNNKDGFLSAEEMVDNYELFVGSQITDYGEMLRDEL